MIMFYIVILFQKLKVWHNRYLKFLEFHYIGVVAAVVDTKEEPELVKEQTLVRSKAKNCLLSELDSILPTRQLFKCH